MTGATRVRPTTRARAERLADLGADGIGGFDAGCGEDDAGPWVCRRAVRRTLADFAPGERMAAEVSLAKLRDLGVALAACEARGIFPGKLVPSEIVIEAEGTSGAHLRAESLVLALLGASTPEVTLRSTPLWWTPPAQADGAPWDAAANRYVLGLVAYRLLAGDHPFSSPGLREASEAATSSAPPFEAHLAASLVPGLQSLVLAMLDPTPERRPKSAAEIVARIDALRAGRDVGPRRPGARREPPKAPRSDPAEVSPSRGGTRRWLALLPILCGAVFLAAALARGGGASAEARRTLPVSPRSAPLSTTTASACAACHPRHVADWERSVMAFAARSPLFGALESAVEELAFRDARCPNGGGVLRRAGIDACRDPRSGVAVTGSGGEHWCVNCHAGASNLEGALPAWEASSPRSSSRRPLRDLLSPAALEGVSCAVCHTDVGPAHATGGRRSGNPTWTSTVSGQVFSMRPEERVGLFGIANSGYRLDATSLLTTRLDTGSPGGPIVHARTSNAVRSHLRSSESCGACHDVRLFGADAASARREPFKRLRNAYSEWRSWSEDQAALGRPASTCQDCHMSLFPGLCIAGAPGGGEGGCPPGHRFEARSPGTYARGLRATSSREPSELHAHGFASVDVPLAVEYPQAWAIDPGLDEHGVPVGLEARRVQLLRSAVRFTLGKPSAVGGRLDVPVTLENVGAGHRVPAGFSQERELWIELVVRDARGHLVYEVGRVGGDVDDLRDKVFTRVTTRPDVLDARGQPLGVFGADVVDGPDAPRWTAGPAGRFRGRGLVNLQNGFFRCVRCIGLVDARGRCQPKEGQGRTRADRFEDGDYDPDTGECRSNLTGSEALFETYFPVGALDADRGITKAPDAILDTRSAPPGAALAYVYELDMGGAVLPLTVTARLRFRAFPPFLLRAFADYEADAARRGLRPSGPQVVPSMFARNKIVDLAAASVTVPR